MNINIYILSLIYFISGVILTAPMYNFILFIFDSFMFQLFKCGSENEYEIN